ncbi:hypothetical protein PR048_015044 [Dryococelus australis]|uniref:Uncharacterized protein n=1 Tax=Dryococelus australis TaxID=614101 RepID=A0ABQ9HG11_9NEOP|nr:hypothetical protein PR048_015044 [Dryococelus australis]
MIVDVQGEISSRHRRKSLVGGVNALIFKSQNKNTSCFYFELTQHVARSTYTIRLTSVVASAPRTPRDTVGACRVVVRGARRNIASTCAVKAVHDKNSVRNRQSWIRRGAALTHQAGLTAAVFRAQLILEINDDCHPGTLNNPNTIPISEEIQDRTQAFAWEGNQKRRGWSGNPQSGLCNMLHAISDVLLAGVFRNIWAQFCTRNLRLEKKSKPRGSGRLCETEAADLSVFSGHSPIRVNEVSIEQRQNERAGETGYPRENTSTNGIVRYNSHMRKSGDCRGLKPVRLGLRARCYSSLPLPRPGRKSEGMCEWECMNVTRVIIQEARGDLQRKSHAVFEDSEDTSQLSVVAKILQVQCSGNTTGAKKYFHAVNCKKVVPQDGNILLNDRNSNVQNMQYCRLVLGHGSLIKYTAFYHLFPTELPEISFIAKELRLAGIRNYFTLIITNFAGRMSFTVPVKVYAADEVQRCRDMETSLYNCSQRSRAILSAGKRSGRVVSRSTEETVYHGVTVRSAAPLSLPPHLLPGLLIVAGVFAVSEVAAATAPTHHCLLTSPFVFLKHNELTIFGLRLTKKSYASVRVGRSEVGAAAKCKGGVNERSLRKPEEQRHRPAKFPCVKIHCTTAAPI